MPRTPRGAITLAEEQPRSPRHRRLVAGLVVVVLAAVRHGRGARACGTCGRWCRASSAWSRHPARPSRGRPTRRATPPRSRPSPCSAGCRRGPRRSRSRPPCRSRRCATSSSATATRSGSSSSGPRRAGARPSRSSTPSTRRTSSTTPWRRSRATSRWTSPQAAQKVQRSAAGEAYAQHEAQARVTASVLSGQTHGGMVCAPRGPRVAGRPAARSPRWSRRTSASPPTEGRPR